jgi:hypothetical protein
MSLFGCHCFCRRNHPDRLPICTGDKETTVPFVVERRQVEVPMCGPCAEATRDARGRPQPFVDFYNPPGSSVT